MPMKMENIAPIFKSNLDTKSEQYLQNKKMMLEKLVFLDELLDLAELGGGQRHHERLAKRGKIINTKKRHNEKIFYISANHDFMFKYPF